MLPRCAFWGGEFSKCPVCAACFWNLLLQKDTQKQSGSLITLGLKQHCTLFEFEVLKKVEGAPLQRRKSISVYLFAHLEILVNGGLLKRNCAASSLCDE